MTAKPPHDWPPPGQCYFCPSPPGAGRWTCPFHRTMEAHALTLAVGFMDSVDQPTPAVDGDWTGPVTEWLGTDAGMAAQEAADGFWPPDVDQQDKVALGLMWFSLVTSLVEQAMTAGRLPDIASLTLTTAERDQLLREELDHIGGSCVRRGMRFSLVAAESGRATYEISRGLRRKNKLRFRISVSEFGLVEQVASDEEV